ncbi:MAG: leucine-rich repeat protein, partial [Tenericutes bacterium]|nr:leucine-rich repeat protein [Mycoplasmatota bacterium]
MSGNKGYTLVEVLAVLILLAIIFSIATPRMLDSIDESKKAAFKVSSNSIMNQLQKTYAKGEIEVPSSGKLYVIENNAFVGESININGVLPDSGIIHISKDGEVVFSLYKEDYCAVKDIGQDTITVSNNYAACIINIPQPVSQDCFSRVDDGVQVTITDYDNSCPKNVIIPDTLDGLPVRIIAPMAFYGNQLTSVVLPSTLKIIRQQSFQGNLFTKLVIPNGVTTIEIWAFIYGRIIDLVIADSVTNIGFRAFENNNIKTIKFSSNLSEIREEVFAHNDIENLIIPNNIQKISFGAFGYNPLKTIDIGSGLNEFNYSSGQYSSNNANVFSMSDDLQITISPLNQYFVALNGGIYSKDMKEIVFGTPSVANNIPSQVETIGIRAFSNMNTENLILSGNIKTIKSEAFYTNNISNLVISEGTTEIMNGAFYGNQISNLSIPTSVIKIGTLAFNNNKLPDNQAFIYDRNPDGSQDATKLIGYGGAKKNGIVIPTSVNTIKYGAFYYSGISSITIPNTVHTIEDMAFYLNNLSSITIPNTVTFIGQSVFSRNNLTSIVLPES